MGLYDKIKLIDLYKSGVVSVDICSIWNFKMWIDLKWIVMLSLLLKKIYVNSNGL